MFTILARWRPTFTRRVFSTSSNVQARQRRLPRKVVALVTGSDATSTGGRNEGELSDLPDAARLEKETKFRGNLMELATIHFIKQKRLAKAMRMRRKMLDENVRLSPLTYAKFLILQRNSHELSLENFQKRLGECLFQGARRISDADFTSFMKSLEEMKIQAEVMEEISSLYVISSPNVVRASGRIIAALVSKSLAEDNVARADHWLDFHCEKVATTEPSLDESHDAAPFSAYIRGLSKRLLKQKPSSSEAKSAHDYTPLISKMHQARIWPDTDFINALLQAELLQDRATQALALYEFLRRQGASNENLAPNAETFSNLFEVFRRLTRRQRQLWKRNQATLAQNLDDDGSGVSALTPWSVFRDMVYSQRKILSSHQDDGELQRQESHPDVLTTRSNIAALHMFVETADYTCALAALASFAEFRLSLVSPRPRLKFSLSSPPPSPTSSPVSATSVIVRALTNRCRAELTARRSRSSNILPTWTDLFLGLAPGERARLMHFPRADTERRVLQLASSEIDYERYPALRSFVVSEEKFLSKDLGPPSPESDMHSGKRRGNLEQSKKRWRARQLRILSTLLHHAVIAESNLSLVNTERPEDVLLRSLRTSGPLAGRSRVFM